MFLNMVQKLLLHASKIHGTLKSFVVLSKFLVNFGLYMRFVTLIFFFLTVALASAQAQKKVQLQKGAGKLIGGIKNGERIERVIDNVVFVQNTTTIYCDSAWFYRSKNMIEAFGRVRIVEGDSVTITASHLEYDGNKKKAKLRNNVVFTKLATATLYTDFL